MKKIILILSTSVAPLLFANQAFCQTQAKHITFTTIDSAFIASNDAKSLPTVPEVAADAINNKAIRGFNKDFKNAESVKWFKIKDGFVSYCRINGNKNKVFYNEKGNWTGNIVYYNDKTMPRELRSMIRSIYYDYAITQVEEVHSADKKIFQVHLEDEKSWKLITVAEGEITLVTEYEKSISAN